MHCDNSEWSRKVHVDLISTLRFSLHSLLVNLERATMWSDFTWASSIISILVGYSDFQLCILASIIVGFIVIIKDRVADKHL